MDSNQSWSYVNKRHEKPKRTFSAQWLLFHGCVVLTTMFIANHKIAITCIVSKTVIRVKRSANSNKTEENDGSCATNVVHVLN